MSTFIEFCTQHNIKDKYTSDNIELFVTSLASKGLKASTIRTTLSGIRHYCTSNSIMLHVDEARLALLLRGAQRSYIAQPRYIQPKNAVRLSHLKKLCSAALHIFDPVFASQVRAMFSLAFFALLRPSELALAPSTPQHQLRRSSITFKQNCVKISFSSFKHSKSEVSVKIPRQSSEVCPWYLLSEYLRLHRDINANDPLFPCSTSDISSLLLQCIVHCGIKSKLTLHSFRCGGATWYSENGMTDAKLKATGRWNSNAYLKYVKP